jgi:Ran-binding protein 1
VQDKVDETEPDVHFQPVVTLQEVDVKTHEEEEECLFKMRAKLFRFEKLTTEWKERGTGEIRLLKHTVTGKVRVLMRRDKTLKICANHLITSDMKLQSNVGSDRSWVWTALADFSEGEAKTEMLAVRFANSGIANHYKSLFEECQDWNARLANGDVKPNDPSCPKCDPDAADVKPEEGSEKKKKEDAVAEAHDSSATQAAKVEPPATSSDETVAGVAPVEGSQGLALGQEAGSPAVDQPGNSEQNAQSLDAPSSVDAKPVQEQSDVHSGE